MASSSKSGVRVHYPNLWWGRMPLMDDNAVFLPLSETTPFRSRKPIHREAQDWLSH